MRQPEPEDPYTAEFIGLMDAQPQAQRESLEELYWLMCLAATCSFRHQHALRDATGPTKGLVKSIRKHARIAMNSPVEEYQLKHVLGLCLKAAATMKRLDETYDQEARDSWSPRLRECINDILEQMES